MTKQAFVVVAALGLALAAGSAQAGSKPGVGSGSNGRHIDDRSFDCAGKVQTSAFECDIMGETAKPPNEAGIQFAQYSRGNMVRTTGGRSRPRR
jgi:hypothetical protein